ncbi:hypothetical protein [Pseudonocardia acaciae]|uniref:hypothetical protein n=1 Tax=Pseudonocardia acaciae TaxID=551276 RepID=UPI00048A7564|nr:hypothetical protein [Pseudonocardia acaciae]
MRGRTLLASTTLALLTVVWSAPAALAAPNDSEEPKPPASSAPARPHTQQQPGADTETPAPKPAPKPAEQPKTTEAPKPSEAKPLPAPVQKPSPAPSSAPAIAIPEPKATLTVSPKSVKQGESITADAKCENGQVSSLRAPDVSFAGNSGKVADNARVGARTVTLVCVNGSKRADATDSFEIVAKDGTGTGDVRASLAVSPKSVRPGGTINANPRCETGRVDSLSAADVSFGGNTGRVSDRAPEGERTVTLTCVDGAKRGTATDTFRVDRNGLPGIGEPKAYLAVSPRVVKQGEIIYANGYCLESTQVALFGDGVSFRGNRGYVDDNAREGDHTVTRICRSGAKEDRATDTFRVDRGGGWPGTGPADFWMSDRSGYRGDSVDVSVRCRDNNARLESNALDDITLRRDGSRLTGTTHVERNADYGWHRVTVYCDGHSTTAGFWVNREHGDHDRYLTLKPGSGHRGDSIDVYVGCDRSLGRLESDVLDDIDLDRKGRGSFRWSGTTHVEDDADRGEHTVKIRCGDDTLEETFFVRGDDDKDDDGGDGGDGGGPSGGDYVTVYPKGGVETGGGPAGGSAGLVALGLTGVTGAGMPGAGSARGRRGERR